jgi:hypothetical protein
VSKECIKKSSLIVFLFRAVACAVANLQQPDKNVSDAVDVRQELDLRIGELPFVVD